MTALPVMILCTSFSLSSFEMILLLIQFFSRSPCIPMNSFLLIPWFWKKKPIRWMQWMFSFSELIDGQNAFKSKFWKGLPNCATADCFASPLRIILHSNLHWALAVQHLKFMGEYCIQGNCLTEHMVVLVLHAVVCSCMHWAVATATVNKNTILPGCQPLWSMQVGVLGWAPTQPSGGNWLAA